MKLPPATSQGEDGKEARASLDAFPSFSLNFHGAAPGDPSPSGVPSFPDGYSSRSAMTGSTRLAVCAGPSAARTLRTSAKPSAARISHTGKEKIEPG